MLYIRLELGILIFAAVLLYVALTNRVYLEVDEQLMEQAGALTNELENAPFYFWSGRLGSFANHYQGAIQLVGSNGLILFRSDHSLIDKGGNDVSQALGNTFRKDVATFASTK